MTRRRKIHLLSVLLPWSHFDKAIWLILTNEHCFSEVDQIGGIRNNKYRLMTCSLADNQLAQEKHYYKSYQINWRSRIS